MFGTLKHFAWLQSTAGFPCLISTCYEALSPVTMIRDSIFLQLAQCEFLCPSIQHAHSETPESSLEGESDRLGTGGSEGLSPFGRFSLLVRVCLE
jgi:hypothetical protein